MFYGVLILLFGHCLLLFCILVSLDQCDSLGVLPSMEVASATPFFVSTTIRNPKVLRGYKAGFVIVGCARVHAIIGAHISTKIPITRRPWVVHAVTVPLCRGHHRELHNAGNELAWWGKLKIEPLQIAKALWEQTHPQVAPVDTLGK
jgi:hypothetical protein